MQRQNTAELTPADLGWLTASQVVRGIRSGLISPKQLVSVTLDRISRLDPRVHAYTYVDRNPAWNPGSIEGVTMAVKDNLAVKGMPWTFGSPKWRTRIADHDSMPVARTRAAGAVILGKANLPELAASVGTTNELFPDTHNPRKSGITPGGSSGGSAAAVAAGLAAAALGTDMGGSIRIPAACCGVVGLRPSVERQLDINDDVTGLSVPGPLCRSVEDARWLFALLAGETSRPTQPRRLRVGIPSHIEADIDTLAGKSLEGAVTTIERLGHRIGAFRWEAHQAIDAYRVIRPYSLGRFPGDLGEYGADLRATIASGRALPAAEFHRALDSGLRAGERLRALVASEFDVLLTPTLGRQPMPIAHVPRFLESGWDTWVQFVLPVSFSKLPAIVLPTPIIGELPGSIQLIGTPRGEWHLFDIAEELEAAGFVFQRPPDCD